MWRALYTLGLRLAAPLVVLRLWWRGLREPGYRERIGERFGFYRDTAPVRPVLWLHAVSVGEARASAALVRALAVDHPGHELLLTCMTAAGRETLKELHGESVTIAWLPYDYPGAVRRFLEYFRPRLALLVETELWPNLLAGCASFGVPVLLANARLSEKSAAGYRRLGAIARPAIGSLALVCAQGAQAAARLSALGARTRGTDAYVSATKLFLAQGVLVSATLRATKANQNGLLGFGSAADNRYALLPEVSLAWLLNRRVAVGAEVRAKPDKLNPSALGAGLKEDDWSDVFIAWAPNKNVSLTLAWVELGRIVPAVVARRQHGAYLSAQLAF